ncbi:MAG: hypothetical protein ACRDWS_03290 [Acidimicrobiia bacterium]
MFLQVARVEALVADWKSLPIAILIASAFALSAADREPGLAGQGTLIRMGFAALSVGVLLALENDEGEATAALHVGFGLRLLGRLTTVASVWLLSVVLVLVVSEVPTSVMPRLALEASVLNLIVILFGAIGLRTLIPQYTTGAALAFAGGFLVSMMLPASVSPWWNGVDPVSEPSTSGWFIVGAVVVLLAVLSTRRSTIWTAPSVRRLKGAARQI